MVASSDADESEAESTFGRFREKDPGRGLGRVKESQSEGEESVNRGKKAIARAAAARATVAALKGIPNGGVHSGRESGGLSSEEFAQKEGQAAENSANGVNERESTSGANLQGAEAAALLSRGSSGDLPEANEKDETGADGLHIDLTGLPSVKVPSSRPAPSPSKASGIPLRSANLPPHAVPGPSKLGHSTLRKLGDGSVTENRGGAAGTSGEAPPGKPLNHRRQLSTSSEVSTSSWGLGSEASGLEGFDVHGSGLVAVGEMSKELRLALPLDQVG
jgi:hypothetical protein